MVFPTDLQYFELAWFFRANKEVQRRPKHAFIMIQQQDANLARPWPATNCVLDQEVLYHL